VVPFLELIIFSLLKVENTIFFTEKAAILIKNIAASFLDSK